MANILKSLKNFIANHGGDVTEAKNIAAAIDELNNCQLDGGGDNIMFVHLTLDTSTSPARYACDTKKIDVWNALDKGKLVYAVVKEEESTNAYMAQKAGDGNVMFTQYYIIGHALTMDFYEQDFETQLSGDADGRSWKFVEYNYSLTLT